MSSDLYGFDSFFTDSFSSLYDSSIDIIRANNQNSVDEFSYIDQFAHNHILTCSLPSHLLESLSLCQTNNHLQPLAPNGYQDFACLDSMEVKSEDSLAGFDISSYSAYNQIQQETLVAPQSYSGAENVAKHYMQGSNSSNSFDGGHNKPGFLFQPHFNSLLESPNIHNQSLSSPENSFFAGQMRRVCSTGDLQNIRTPHKTQRSFSSNLANESSFTEEANFKVSPYSAEERKERILKYRAKRNQRNFNKTIKYACRKTLADSRPRVRGRFARNDEAYEIPTRAACSARYEDDDELWFDEVHQEEEEEEDRAIRGEGGPFVSSFGQQQQHQLQYYGCY